MPFWKIFSSLLVILLLLPRAVLADSCDMLRYSSGLNGKLDVPSLLDCIEALKSQATNNEHIIDALDKEIDVLLRSVCDLSTALKERDLNGSIAGVAYVTCPTPKRAPTNRAPRK